jgi:hypothetical protein
MSESRDVIFDGSSRSLSPASGRPSRVAAGAHRVLLRDSLGHRRQRSGHARGRRAEWLEEETDRSTPTTTPFMNAFMQSGPIEGFLLHIAGFTGRGFRLFEVWETREQYDRFIEETADADHPGDRRVGCARAGEVAVYELHGFVVSPHAAEVRASKGAGPGRHEAREPLLPSPEGSGDSAVARARAAYRPGATAPPPASCPRRYPGPSGARRARMSRARRSPSPSTIARSRPS